MNSNTHRISFLNTSFGNILSRISYNSTFAFALSRNPQVISDHVGSDIKKMCEWVETDGAECVVLSEVPGGMSVDTLETFLQYQGYQTYTTEALDLWAQDGDYQLFQVVAVRGAQPIVTHQVFYKKYPWLYAAFYSVISGVLSRDIRLGKKVFMRLISWVRDGVITVLEYTDHCVYTGHIHYWCDEIEAFLSSNLGHTLKPALIIGDMNVPSAQTLLKRDFFKESAFEWVDRLLEAGKTFGFNAHLYPRWMGWFMYQSPDVILSRSIHVTSAENIVSLSDHNRIAAEYSVLQPQ